MICMVVGINSHGQCQVALSLFTHLTNCAFCFAAASAGSSIAAKIGIIIRATADTINPASAIPKPVNVPRLFFTFVTAMIPRIKPKIAVKPQENIPNIPKTSEVTAIPLNFEVLADSLLARVGGTGLFNTS